jgi:hypothetical protein
LQKRAPPTLEVNPSIDWPPAMGKWKRLFGRFVVSKCSSAFDQTRTKISSLKAMEPRSIAATSPQGDEYGCADGL